MPGPDDSKKLSISISTESVLKVIGILIAVGFLWLIRDIIALIFVSFILASAFDPTVDIIQRFRIPRAVGIVVIYVVFFSVLTFVVVGISGPIATEVRNIAQELPKYYAEINASLERFQSANIFDGQRVSEIQGGLDQVILNLTRLASGNVLPVVSSIFGGLVSILLVLVITFYFSVHEGAVKKFLIWIVPKGREQESVAVMEKIQKKLGLWLRGQVLLSLIIFVVTYVGLKLLGVKYALVLALLAGFFEVIPYLGPILSAVPAVFLSLISPWGGIFKAVLVTMLYIVIQQAENNIIVPKVMSRTIGLNPLIVIISILIGVKIAGVVGALMAVPLASAVTVYLQERGYYNKEVST